MTPLRITTETLRAHLREYRQLARAGTRILITRNGRPECALVPVNDLAALGEAVAMPQPVVDAKGRIGPYRHMLGRLSDAEIGGMAGMTRQAVSYHRRRMGIGVGWK